MSDLNDLTRKKVDAIERRKKITVARADFLQTVVAESRGMTADELTKDEKFAADTGAIDTEIRSIDAQLAAAKILELAAGWQPETKHTPRGSVQAHVMGSSIATQDKSPFVQV